MINLLKANFARLTANWIFRIGLIASAVMGVMAPVYGHRLMVISGAFATGFCPDYYFFKCVIYVVLIFTAFGGFYIGAEYHNGMIRNKVVAGCPRHAIYLSNFVTISIAGFAMFSVYMFANLVRLPKNFFSDCDCDLRGDGNRLPGNRVFRGQTVVF